MPPWFRDRSTADLLVILIAATVCAAILIGEISIAVVELTNPQVDTSASSGVIGDVINTLIGLIAGYLAGRTEVARLRREREEEK